MTEKNSNTKKGAKSPALAGILAVIFPGAGTLYNGQLAKGFFYMVIFAGLVTIQTYSGGQPFKGLILAGFYIFQIIESVHTARGINLTAVESALKPASEQSDLVPAGSIFWGIFLIILGILFILANFGILSYSKLVDFWPLAVIIIGLRLVYDALKSKNGK